MALELVPCSRLNDCLVIVAGLDGLPWPKMAAHWSSHVLLRAFNPQTPPQLRTSRLRTVPSLEHTFARPPLW
jgi:hypothetical protein